MTENCSQCGNPLVLAKGTCEICGFDPITIVMLEKENLQSNEIEKLEDLHKSGALTSDEFQGEYVSFYLKIGLAIIVCILILIFIRQIARFIVVCAAFAFFVFGIISMIISMIKSSTSRTCGVCGRRIKKASYRWNLRGQNTLVCPPCNQALERKNSRAAVNSVWQ